LVDGLAPGVGSWFLLELDGPAPSGAGYGAPRRLWASGQGLRYVQEVDRAGAGKEDDVRIVRNDLTGPEVAHFLEVHRDEMAAVTPPESMHAMDVAALRAPGVLFWTAVEGPHIVGCGALKPLSQRHGEVKSMRTARAHRGRGIASAVLAVVIEEASRQGMTRLSLETGSSRFFEPARGLYLKHGFEYCGPFGSYCEDPNSVFMTRELEQLSS